MIPVLCAVMAARDPNSSVATSEVDHNKLYEKELHVSQQRSPTGVKDSQHHHHAINFRSIEYSNVDHVSPPLPNSTVTTPISRDYERLGCFKDKGEDRVLGNKMTNDTHQTPDVRTPAEALYPAYSAATRRSTKHGRSMDS